jgi:hypothetical protein
MATSQIVVTVPNVSLTLDQLLTAIRQLDESARVQVAQALLETDLNPKMAALIRRLADRRPADKISDALINEEVQAARRSHRSN